MEKKTDLKLSTWKRIRPLAAVTANFSSLFYVDEMIINKPSRFQQLEQICTLKGNFFTIFLSMLSEMFAWECR